MAGGKETPRQKMIGMMYLVLTALLALNVSKSILDAFVNFDNNIKEGTATISEQSNDAYSTLRELAATGEAGKKEKAKKIIPIAEDIIALTKEKVTLLNQMRDKLIQKAGEEISQIKQKGVNEDDFNYLLDRVQAKDNFDVSMEVMIGSDIKRPDQNKDGMKLWETIIEYRNTLPKVLATYGDFGFSAEEYMDNKESALQKVNYEDREVVERLFANLTKIEYADIHDGEIKDVHWVGRTFDHAPLVAALATLSSIEQEIKTAEAISLRHLRAKIGGSDYSFDKVAPLAFSPSSYYNAGDSITFHVMMAAYDSYNQPKIEFSLDSTASTQATDILVNDGKGVFKIKASGSGAQKVYGSIEIQKKNGTTVKQPWRFDYAVGKPNGAISLPEMNLLYRGKENKVIGAASGFQGYGLTMTNGSITNKGEYWDARPGRGRASIITITGISGDTKATLGSTKFRVSNMPTPDIKFGNVKDGAKISNGDINAMNMIFPIYSDGIPLDANLFTVRSYDVSNISSPRPVKVSGRNMKAEVKRLLRSAPTGEKIYIRATLVGQSGETVFRTIGIEKH